MTNGLLQYFTPLHFPTNSKHEKPRPI